MSDYQSRRKELARIALEVLAVLPRSDQRPVFTGWVSRHAGLDADVCDYFVPQYLYNLLRRLARLGLVERVSEAWMGGHPYWRLTPAGERYEGSEADIMRPIQTPSLKRFGAQSTAAVLAEVRAERLRQDAKWGQQNHPNGSIGTADDVERATLARRHCQANTPDQDNWRDILDEEVAEAYACGSDAELRTELVQVAAVVAAWIECINRRRAA